MGLVAALGFYIGEERWRRILQLRVFGGAYRLGLTKMMKLGRAFFKVFGGGC